MHNSTIISAIALTCLASASSLHASIHSDYEALVANGTIIDNATPQGYFLNQMDKAMLVDMASDPRQMRDHVEVNPIMCYMERSRTMDAQLRDWYHHNPTYNDPANGYYPVAGINNKWHAYFLGYWESPAALVGFEYDLNNWYAEGHQLYKNLETLPYNDTVAYEIKTSSITSDNEATVDVALDVIGNFDESKLHAEILWAIDLTPEDDFDTGAAVINDTTVGVGSGFEFVEDNADYQQYTFSACYTFSPANANPNPPTPQLWSWEMYWGNEANPVTNYLEASYLPKAEGWYESEWFGDFYAMQEGDGWIYQPNFGWAYATGENASSFWVYPSDENLGWTWTGNATWPWAWSTAQNDWVYFDTVNNTGYWLATNGNWVTASN